MNAVYATETQCPTATNPGNSPVSSLDFAIALYSNRHGILGLLLRDLWILISF